MKPDISVHVNIVERFLTLTRNASERSNISNSKQEPYVAHSFTRLILIIEDNFSLFYFFAFNVIPASIFLYFLDVFSMLRMEHYL